MAIPSLPKTRSFLWKKTALKMLDQRVLPHEVIWYTYRTWQDVASGITKMVVRGAPAIGCTAAYGLVLAAQQKQFKSLSEQLRFLDGAAEGLIAARPTAVNLKWAVDRMRDRWQVEAVTKRVTPSELVRVLEREAILIEEEDRASNKTMGLNGARLFKKNASIMTICNTGSLATAGLGTAFGVLWTCHHLGKLNKVIACETRPYLQGARLTAYELQQEGIPFELITDNMAGYLMDRERIDGVIVGADRIAANGDTANKIGTYSLAVLANHHRIPFYVAAPLSTIDLKTPHGRRIPIEERSSDEVTHVRGQRIAPAGIKVRHPAFDVTPSELIAGIITEKGVAKPSYRQSLPKLFK